MMDVGYQTPIIVGLDTVVLHLNARAHRKTANLEQTDRP